MPPQWAAFAFAVPISLYVSCLGTAFMGFCPGVTCWPHTFAWTLLSPCLLLAIWSLSATAIAATLLLAAHVYTDVHIYGEGFNLDTLWGADAGLDKGLWLVVLLLIISAAFSARRRSNPETA